MRIFLIFGFRKEEIPSSCFLLKIVASLPLIRARTEDIKRKGRNPLYEYTLPKAILKFKQGFGRLIRSEYDIDRVIICDDRIETMPYDNGDSTFFTVLQLSC